jgi:bifunctional non-homologous end joining protein LigD
MTKEMRRGKVFIDWSQNTAHKSTVVPFSLRARERPTVAVPLEWSEVAAVGEGESDPGDLLLVTGQVLEQMDARGALAEPC